MSRRAAGEGSIHKLPDGRWRATVDLPSLDGRRRRKSVTGHTRKEAADKLTRLRKKVADGATLGDTMTVTQWLDHWLGTVAKLRTNTAKSHESKIRVHITPGIGKVRLDRLTPEHLERFYAQLTAGPPWPPGQPLSPATVIQIHRILHAALRVAEKRRRITRNPASLVSPPSRVYKEARALTRDQAWAVLDEAAKRRSATRWQAALAAGMRQGEVLGACWPALDLTAGTLKVATELVWVGFSHGCDDPDKCGADLKPILRKRRCPERQGGKYVLEEPKSVKSRRTVSLPAELVDALKAWRKTTLEERMALGERWRGFDRGDLIFAQPNGRPINQRADWGEWQDILDAAGVPRMGTHGTRHTGATMLLNLGRDVKIVSEWLGHSQTSLTQGIYQHVEPEQLRDVADSLGAALFGPR